MQQQNTQNTEHTKKINKTYHSKKFLPLESHEGNKGIIPSRDCVRIWQNCFSVASLFVGYKYRNFFYNIEDMAKRAEQVTQKLIYRLFMRFYQDGDHMVMLKVSYNLELAFNMLRGVKGNFGIDNIIDTAFAITMGDPALALSGSES